MYGRRRGLNFTSLISLIIVGIVAGVVFVMVDNQQPSPANTQMGDNQTIVTPTIYVEPTIPQETPATTMPTNQPTDSPPDSTAANVGQPLNSDDFLPEIPEGTSLFIPSAGIYAPIVQAYLDGTSWDVSRLGTNVGHLEGTSWFNEPGNVVLSGHVELADGRQGVFATLDDLQVNDIIVLNSNGQERRYIITNIDSTSPDDLSPVMPTTEDRLTLITCGNYDFFQDSYLERLIVVATPIS
ncbi:MAG: sortase [Anaerolineae bacterium]|nr:sortase [Anaerolineae bacterium]